jgi:crotonobetainyl-CoA:carnitine CoA-transferase CaiB-like acyl-CoA transferase
MIQAMGGLMSVTGEADGKTGGGPQKVGVPVTDIMTGMYATVAVLAGLARRNETGRGDYIDIGMLDVQVGFLANQAMNFLISGRPPRRSGNAHPNIQPQDVFGCRDGHMALVVGNDSQFEKFCTAVGRPEWARDERFTSNAGRVRNREALHALIAGLFVENDVAHWAGLIEAAGVPCAPINTIPMVLEEPQVKHREMLRRLPHPTAGSVPQIVSPIRYAEAVLDYDRPPPLLGQHTDDVLRELGLAADDKIASQS